MTLSRASSKAISRWLIGVLLFAQFMVASYACPGLSGMTTTSPKGGDVMVMADMGPGCDQMGMDQEAANLCAEHCRFGQQSADTAPVPVVHAASATLLYSLPALPVDAVSFGSGRPVPDTDVSLAAAPPPPHAILHCVFRI